ncbi:elongation factor P [Deferrisoma camini]|uniref:elongation factor P n=1 Tax=Deferrisoma camini TaxID=1035120 RepID=UPI00046CA659|nr:elongation factor P [Deferrisoma camini]
MYKAGDLRKGLKLELDGEPYVIVDFEFSKPGKGQALYRCRLKNMLTGIQFDRTYRSGDTFKPADVEERKMTYLYTDGQFYTFMDQKTYEQYQVSAEQLGDSRYFLTDNLEVDVVLWQDKAIGVTLPNFVVLTVTRADPAARGDTATNVTKPVLVETGYELQAPAFVEEGDRIQIDTRTGQYVTRVKE